MTRQRIGEKKVQKYREATGLDVVLATVRGDRNHEVVLYLAGGRCVAYQPRTGEVKPLSIGWSPDRVSVS